MTQVPFQGQPEIAAALLGGHLDAASISISIASNHIKNGTMRALAISSHWSDIPDIPTLKELVTSRTFWRVGPTS